MNTHLEQKLVAYQTGPFQIIVYSSKTYKAQAIKVAKPEKQIQIIHFEWIYQLKGHIDFFTVETIGIRLFKIDEEKHALKEVKIFSQKISACWFEPKNEVLVTTSYEQPGLIQTFYFNEKRKDYKYRGPDLVLDDFQNQQNLKSAGLSQIFAGSSKSLSKSPKEFMNQSFTPPSDKKNKDITIDDKCLEQPHRIFLTNLYGKSYFLYSNTFTGKIIFYHLSYEKIVKQGFVLSFPSDIQINLSVVDNLIVLSAINERISIVSDIKKQKPDAPLGPAQPIERSNSQKNIQIKSEMPQSSENLEKRHNKDDLLVRERAQSPKINEEVRISKSEIFSSNIVQTQLTDLENYQNISPEKEQVRSPGQEGENNNQEEIQLQDQPQEGQKDNQQEGQIDQKDQEQRMGQDQLSDQNLNKLDQQEEIPIFSQQSQNPDKQLQVQRSIEPQEQQEQKDDRGKGYNFFTSDKSLSDHNLNPTELSEVQFGFDFEGFFNDLRESEKERRLRDQFIVKMKWTVKPAVNESQIRLEESQNIPYIYDKNCNYLEDDLIVDTKKKILYQFQLNLQYLPKLLDDESESFLSLLRRSNSKNHIFEFLRDLVIKKKQIMIFSWLYKHVFEILTRAYQEQRHRQEHLMEQQEVSEKISNGYTILYPADFQNQFFTPLIEDHSINRTYIIELIVEFIRQFNENMRDQRVSVPGQIQNQLIKLLIKNNRMSYVHFMLQYQVLSDNVDFAKLLIDISSREILEQKKLLGKYQVYEPALQLGIDMLHRLQRQDEMLDIFFKRGMFQEAAHLLRKYNILNKIKIQSISEGLKNPKCDFSKLEIINYFEDLQRKIKGERLPFTIDELKQHLFE